MGKPTSTELNDALQEAARMREQGDDPHFIAKSLLNLHYRINHLEKVMHAAERYLHGQAIHEHSVLIRAIEAAHKADTRTTGKDDDRLV